MKRTSETLNLGYCLGCGKALRGQFLELLGSDPEFLTSSLGQCEDCRDKDARFLRVARIPRYQCHYLSTHGDELCGPFALTAYSIHFYVTAETYETFFPDAWNGFKQVCKPDDIPALYEVSVPETHYRMGFIVDAVLLIASFVASGILGGISYDLLKKQGRRMWERLPKAHIKKVEPLVQGAPVQMGDDFERVFESAFIYLNRRLAGLKALSAPDGILFKAARYLGENTSVSSRELAERLNCSIEKSKSVLKILGAHYSLSTKKWELPPHLECYYKEKKAEGNTLTQGGREPFFVRGGPTREVGWSLNIPKPPGLCEDEEMDFEVAVLQATTPDTEAFLRGDISDQELQQRVYLKAAALAKSYEKRKKRSQQTDPADKE